MAASPVKASAVGHYPTAWPQRREQVRDRFLWIILGNHWSGRVLVMIKHKQPQGVTRRRLDGPPTNNYEIRRVAGAVAILGYTERVNGGWRVRKEASGVVIES